MSDPKKLLCVIAHPDDEAAGFGGALQAARGLGIETHILCLTAGEAGSYRGAARSREELAALRRREFALSCGVLQTTSGEVLSYPDGRLDAVDMRSAVGDLTERIRRLRPQWLFTFGPEGTVTAHNDHSTTSMLATLAYQWAGRSNRYPEQLEEGLEPWRPTRLYYSTADYCIPTRQPIANSPIDVTLHLTDEQMRLKIAAFESHTTQQPLYETFRNQMIPRGAVEYFHLAATTEASSDAGRRELWAGVE